MQLPVKDVCNEDSVILLYMYSGGVVFPLAGFLLPQSGDVLRKSGGTASSKIALSSVRKTIVLISLLPSVHVATMHRQ